MPAPGQLQADKAAMSSVACLHASNMEMQPIKRDIDKQPLLGKRKDKNNKVSPEDTGVSVEVTVSAF